MKTKFNIIYSKIFTSIVMFTFFYIKNIQNILTLIQYTITSKHFQLTNP